MITQQNHSKTAAKLEYVDSMDQVRDTAGYDSVMIQWMQVGFPGTKPPVEGYVVQVLPWPLQLQPAELTAQLVQAGAGNA